MKREVTLYLHRCSYCDWEAIRGEEQRVNYCSHCGHHSPPVVETKEVEFDVRHIQKTYEEDLEKFRKSAEYTKRLKAGEDPEDIEAELLSSTERYFSDTFVNVGIVRALSCDAIRVKAFGCRGSLLGGGAWVESLEAEGTVTPGGERNKESY